MGDEWQCVDMGGNFLPDCAKIFGGVGVFACEAVDLGGPTTIKIRGGVDEVIELINNLVVVDDNDTDATD